MDDPIISNEYARAVAARAIKGILQTWHAVTDIQTMLPGRELNIDLIDEIAAGIEGDEITDDAVTALLRLFSEPEEPEETDPRDDGAGQRFASASSSIWRSARCMP